jgi:hypothetical protein
MTRALSRRGMRATATLMALSTAILMATGSSALAAASPSQGSSACASKTLGAPRDGRFGGIVTPVSVTTGCQVQNASIRNASAQNTGVQNTGVQNTSDAAVGTPPLIFHGGPVMGTRSTGPLVITPIFWNPAGHQMTSAYKDIITTYLADVARSSGSDNNVYSVPTEYYGSNGTNRYRIELGTPINDKHQLPADGCTVASTDTQGIYADNSGYDACLDDAQVIAETDRIVAERGLPRDFAHIYVLYLPKHVESCFSAGSTTTASNACTINYQPSAAYCAYHSQAPSGTVYANMPYPIYLSATKFTCGTDVNFPGVVQTPNGNPDADTEISPTSHEVVEAITDPDTQTGWYDSKGFEIGDECAYIFGQTSGTPGQLYNQVIGHHHYLTQEEFSNRDFFVTGGGCVQSKSAEA